MPSTPPARSPFDEAFDRYLEGNLQAARASMPDYDHLEGDAQRALWWQMQGIFAQHEGALGEAEDALAKAEALCPREHRAYGNVRFSQGGVYGLTGKLDEAIRAYFDARLSFRRFKANPELVAVGYNLGWNMTQRYHLDDAATTFEEVLTLAERWSPNEYAPLISIGRAQVWVLTGEDERARGAAAWAAGRTNLPELQARAQLLYCQAVWLGGRRHEAREHLQQVLESLAPLATEVVQQQFQLQAAVWSGNSDVLLRLVSRAVPAVQVRAALHLAALRLRAEDEGGALQLMQQYALEALPYPLHLTRRFEPELFEFARRHGLPVPGALALPARVARLRVRGEPQLTVAGRTIQARLTEPSAAVIAYLAGVEGSRSAHRIASYVLGTRTLHGVRRALHQIRLLFGSPDCILEDRTGLSLNPYWQWIIDDAGSEPRFRMLDTPYVRDLNE